MNALVSMQAEKRRLHAVPSCGSDRLKLHFREGSVAGISHLQQVPQVLASLAQAYASDKCLLASLTQAYASHRLTCVTCLSLCR